MEPEGSGSCSREPATGPSSEPYESNPQPPTRVSFHPRIGSPSGLFPSGRSRYSDRLSLDDRGVGVRVLAGSRIFTSPFVQTGSGAHPTSYTVGTGCSFPGVKRPGHEADPSPRTSAEVKKIWIFTSTPPYVFMG
jgi:hypothetical protein